MTEPKSSAPKELQKEKEEDLARLIETLQRIDYSVDDRSGIKIRKSFS